MGNFFHGARTRQAQTSISTPRTAASGVPFVVGTAPVHMVAGGAVNVPVMGLNNADAVTALGYSDDWAKYSLCEVMFSSYRLYQTAPVFFVNVLDPARHRTTVAAAPYAIENRRVRLPLETIADSVEVEGYVADIDFALVYDTDALVLEILDSGSIAPSATELSIAYIAVDPSLVTKADIVGGFNVATKETTGLELIEQVFPRFGMVPDIIIAPGWSHDAEVAAVMTAKAANINGVFEAKALIDVDTEAVTHFSEVPAWKSAQNITDKRQILCFPMVRLAERVFHLSTQMAALMGQTDNNNGGVPSQSPSNQRTQINGLLLGDGKEVVLDITAANFLNANGIVTALNIGGFVLWGNRTAAFPDGTDVKDVFIPVSRMFGWVGNSLILSTWNRLDSKMTRRFVDSIVDSINIWLNGLTSSGHLLGGRVELRADENPLTDLMSGIIRPRVFLTPPTPAEQIEYILEFDVAYLSAAFH